MERSQVLTADCNDLSCSLLGVRRVKGGGWVVGEGDGGGIEECLMRGCLAFIFRCNAVSCPGQQGQSRYICTKLV